MNSMSAKHYVHFLSTAEISRPALVSVLVRVYHIFSARYIYLAGIIGDGFKQFTDIDIERFCNSV